MRTNSLNLKGSNLSGIARLLLAAVLLFCVTACENEAEIKAQISEQVPEGFVRTDISIASGKISGTFNEDGQVVYMECSVTLSGNVEGEPVETKVYKVRLEAQGTKGGKYELDCTDPLIVQFPRDAHNFVASYRGPNGRGNLLLDAGLSEIRYGSQDHEFITAEPGHQLVIIGVDPTMPPGNYQMTLGFGLSHSRPIEIKPMFTAKATCGGMEMFPPLLPDTPHMTDLPAITIPVSNQPQTISLPLDMLSDFMTSMIKCP